MSAAHLLIFWHLFKTDQSSHTAYRRDKGVLWQTHVSGDTSFQLIPQMINEVAFEGYGSEDGNDDALTAGIRITLVYEIEYYSFDDPTNPQSVVMENSCYFDLYDADNMNELMPSTKYIYYIDLSSGSQELKVTTQISGYGSNETSEIEYLNL